MKLSVDQLLRRYEWAPLAACKNADADLFFPGKGNFGDRAKDYCEKCEVRGECLQTALKERERFGIWGGLTARERQRIPRIVHKLEPAELLERYPVRIRRVA